MDNRKGTTLLTQRLEVHFLADRWRVERSPHVFEQLAPTSPPAFKVFLPKPVFIFTKPQPCPGGHAKVLINFKGGQTFAEIRFVKLFELHVFSIFWGCLCRLQQPQPSTSRFNPSNRKDGVVGVALSEPLDAALRLSVVKMGPSLEATDFCHGKVGGGTWWPLKTHATLKTFG